MKRVIPPIVNTRSRSFRVICRLDILLKILTSVDNQLKMLRRQLRTAGSQSSPGSIPLSQCGSSLESILRLSTIPA